MVNGLSVFTMVHLLICETTQLIKLMIHNNDISIIAFLGFACIFNCMLSLSFSRGSEALIIGLSRQSIAD